MARIFITGSSDGIGQAAAKLLADQGHKVTLHARNADRAKQAKAAVPGAENVLVADISSIAETKKLAAEANKAGPFDCVVHNAGVGYQMGDRKTVDGLATVFAVNSLAPYILTALMDRPKRLLYISSGLHTGGDDSLKDLAWTSGRSWSGFQAYSDSKLQNVLLSQAVARRWSDVQTRSLDPGWVKTKMGGSGAPGTTSAPSKALAAFAAGEHGIGAKSGLHLNPRGPTSAHPAASDTMKQDRYLEICEQLSGVSLPVSK